jgi:hypothetical protein
MRGFSGLHVVELTVRSLAELEDDELFTRERLAPMKRLLGTRDEEYFRSQGCFEQARRTRLEHRQIYNEYLKELSRQVRGQRALRRLSMRGAGSWDARAEIRETLVCESALLYLRWLSWKHFLRMRVDTAAMEDRIADLVPEFQPISRII